MRDLILEELDQVYGAGGRGRKGRAKAKGSSSGRRGSSSGRRKPARRRSRGSTSGRRGSST